MGLTVNGADMFDAAEREGGPHYLCITTNGVVEHDKLTMGRGAAADAKRLFPWIPVRAGQVIKGLFPNQTTVETVTRSRVVRYELVEFSDDDAEHPDRFFAMVQTKLDWRDPSPPELVQASLARLGKKAEGCPHIKFHLNYPAIGLGGLPLEMVQPWVEALPDNVRVYRKSTGAYNRSQP